MRNLHASRGRAAPRASTSARTPGSRTCARSSACSTPVVLDEDDLATEFEPDEPPVLRDSTNQGYIHAPSLNQAVAAAVLRNGYLRRQPANRQHDGGQPHLRARARGARRCSRASAPGRAWARCSATSSSAACTTGTAFAEVDKFIYDAAHARSRCGRPADVDQHGGRATRPTSRRSRRATSSTGWRWSSTSRRPAKRRTRSARTLPQRGPGAGGGDRRRGRAAARRPRRGRRPRARRGRVPGRARQLRPRRLDLRRLRARQLPARAGRRPHARPAASASPTAWRCTSRAGLDASVSPVPGVAVTPRAQAEPAVNGWLAGVLPPLGRRSAAASRSATRPRGAHGHARASRSPTSTCSRPT